MLPYIYALIANFAFSTASIGYEHYSRQFGVLYVNWYKAMVSVTGLALIMLVGHFSFSLEIEIIGILFFSGLIGLGIGDIFLLKAFVQIGTSRSLMLFGFHPLLVGTVEYIYFDSQLNSLQFISVGFLIASLIVVSFEKYKSSGHWEVSGLILAFLCVFCDAIGVVMTKWAFVESSQVNSISANFYRSVGAFIFLSFGLRLIKWPQVKAKQHLFLVVASVVGTLISLLFYLEAIKRGSLAIVSSIAITAPLVAACIESFIEKKWPSKYLLIGFLLFSIGLFTLYITYDSV